MTTIRVTGGMGWCKRAVAPLLVLRGVVVYAPCLLSAGGLTGFRVAPFGGLDGDWPLNSMSARR